MRNSETNNTRRHNMEPQGTHGARDAIFPALTQHRVNIARAKRIGMFTERMEITPAFAAMVLEHFAPEGTNRRLRRGAVAELAELMRAGRWDANTHQGLAFTPEGVLNDGQHRLNAVVQSGVTITAPVTYGQPRQTFMVIDVAHRGRNGADLMEIAGLKMNSANYVAATARLLVALHREAAMTYQEATRAVDYDALVSFGQDNIEGLNDAVRRARSVAQHLKSRVSVTAIASALFLIAKATDPARLDTFCDFLAHGNDLPKNSPILVLREAFRDGTAGGHYKNSQDRLRGAAAAVVQTWNVWRKGGGARSFRALTVETREAFPEPRA